MKKKIRNRRIFILIVIVICAFVFIIINNSEKTVKVAFHEYEDKIDFSGFYYVDEHVIYSGETSGIKLKYKTGDLVPKGTKISDNIVADEAGMVIAHIDGYENKYNKENIKNITVKEINNIVSNAKKDSGIKIVNNSQWYVCALLNQDDKKYFKRGMAKDVNINNKYYTADVINVLKENESTILIMRFKNDLDVENLSRVLKGYIVKSKYYGTTIPEKSVIEYNGSTGVFIDSNGYADFRKVKVIATKKGDVIVLPDKDSKRVLMEYDEVICNPDGLENGKKIR